MLSIWISILIISIYISEVGGWVQLGNRFVSFVRARAAVCKVRMDLKSDPHPFSLFPFGREIPSLFPCEIRCSLSLEIHEIKGIQVRSSEFKWDQVSPSESKWDQVSSSEINWVQVSPREIKWYQVRSSASKWVQVRSCEFKWVQVRSSESKWIQVRSSETKWV